MINEAPGLMSSVRVPVPPHRHQNSTWPCVTVRPRSGSRHITVTTTQSLNNTDKVLSAAHGEIHKVSRWFRWKHLEKTNDLIIITPTTKPHSHPYTPSATHSPSSSSSWKRHPLDMPASGEPRYELPASGNCSGYSRQCLSLLLCWLRNRHTHQSSQRSWQHATNNYLQPTTLRWSFREPLLQRAELSWAEPSRAGRNTASHVWIELSRVELSWSGKGWVGAKEHSAVFESVIRVLVKLKLPLCNQKSSGYFQRDGTYTFDS